MEYHKFLWDVTRRSESLLGTKKVKNPSYRKSLDEFHFTRKFIHLTFLMTMTFDRLRQIENFEADERDELQALQSQYNSVRHMKKKDFLKGKSNHALNFKELFSLDTWFYYKHENMPPIPLPISIESLRKEDDKKGQVSLDELLATIRNAVAHGQIDIGSKSVGGDREMSFIYFCSEWKGEKDENGKRPIIGRKIVALDECALDALICAWGQFVTESAELHRSFALLAK